MAIFRHCIKRGLAHSARRENPYATKRPYCTGKKGTHANTCFLLLLWQFAITEV